MIGRKSGAVRTVDVAHLSGYSVQQIRNLERDGVLPPAARTPAGYRSYGDDHVHSARAYRAVAVATGPVEAKRILRAVHTGPVANLLGLLDAAHARLDRERRDLAVAKAAARAIADEAVADALPSDTMSVAEVADALGVPTSTLRFWDSIGLVVPAREARRGARRYAPDTVRDARIVHQLRLAGYRIPTLQRLLPQLRNTDSRDELRAGLCARDSDIEARSRALLDGAAALAALVRPAGGPQR